MCRSVSDNLTKLSKRHSALHVSVSRKGFNTPPTHLYPINKHYYNSASQEVDGISRHNVDCHHDYSTTFDTHTTHSFPKSLKQ